MPNKSVKLERAALFCPFDALKGLQELLRKKERIVVSKKQLSEDDCALLNFKIQQVHPGMIIRIVYYDKEDYISLEGMVSKIDLEFTKAIWIVQKRIEIKTIIEIHSDEIIEDLSL